LAFPTLICDWINCFRRNTLKGYFSGGSQNNDSLVYGNVGHSMLEGLGTGAYTHMTFEDIISDLHHKYLHEMYLLSNDYEAFEQKCVRKFRSLFDWFSVHVKGKKELEIIPKKLYCTIERVTGCEVRIRSRLFGFKGVIDMLLDCTMRRGNTITRTLVPLELKTGDT
jgi:DNA replication ATP-dependent helicase Dna2